MNVRTNFFLSLPPTIAKLDLEEQPQVGFPAALLQKEDDFHRFSSLLICQLIDHCYLNFEIPLVKFSNILIDITKLLLVRKIISK